MKATVETGLSRAGGRLLTYYQFVIYFLSHLSALGRRPVREVFLRQVYFTAVEPLKRIIVVAALTGMVIITQISQAFGYDAALIGKILVWAVIRELGPFLTAVMMISGSGAAITAELASMKINKEFDTLRAMGIEPMDYLVIPRMASAVASLFLLNACFQAAAILGGFMLSTALIDISFHQHMTSIFLSVGVGDIALSMLKSLAFGVAVASVTCVHGCFVSGSITGIPMAIIGAQTRSLLMVFIADGLITYFAFL